MMESVSSNTKPFQTEDEILGADEDILAAAEDEIFAGVCSSMTVVKPEVKPEEVTTDAMRKTGLMETEAAPDEWINEVDALASAPSGGLSDIPKGMQLMQEEYEWALSIKAAVEGIPELGNRSDMFYAQLALITRGDVAKAVEQCQNLDSASSLGSSKRSSSCRAPNVDIQTAFQNHPF